MVIDDKHKHADENLKSFETFENSLEILSEDESTPEAQPIMSTIDCADELLNLDFDHSHEEDKTFVEGLETEPIVNTTNSDVVEEHCADTLKEGIISEGIVQYATEEEKEGNKEINQAK